MKQLGLRVKKKEGFLRFPNSLYASIFVSARCFTGKFMCSVIVIDDIHGICKECGAKVRDFIRELKKTEDKKKTVIS